MGNCLNNKPPTKRIFILLSLELWPNYQTVNKIKELLIADKIDRLIIGCRELPTRFYWEVCLNGTIRQNRVECVVEPLLESNDYLLVLNKARPELNKNQRKVVKLLIPKTSMLDAEKMNNSAFLEHYPSDEWQIVPCTS